MSVLYCDNFMFVCEMNSIVLVLAYTQNILFNR